LEAEARAISALATAEEAIAAEEQAAHQVRHSEGVRLGRGQATVADLLQLEEWEVGARIRRTAHEEAARAARGLREDAAQTTDAARRRVEVARHALKAAEERHDRWRCNAKLAEENRVEEEAATVWLGRRP
jgi:hypothetical protein